MKKSKTDTEEPNLTKLRTDKVLAMFTASDAWRLLCRLKLPLIESLEPKRTQPRIDRELLNERLSNTDIDEPMVICPKIENAEPNRDHLLRDKELPTVILSSTAKEAPRRHILLTDKELPKCK
jgi:hypothetical protein